MPENKIDHIDFDKLNQNSISKPLIKKIINIIHPELNNPNPAETGSLPKKFISIDVK
jgi:hypothetical protein